MADEKLTYQVFSVWVCDANADTDCIQADPDDAAFQQILDKAVAGCAFDYDMNVTTDDRILTLSTCTADPNSRLLVVAKLIDGGVYDVASRFLALDVKRNTKELCKCNVNANTAYLRRSWQVLCAAR